ncbi:hypothetical protein TorRG33x02_003180 [Trema orientale]|uniref:Uncharacterized protein n=1 Tax=Trema orientale TaxID=63057 RepID=A0A2P5G1S5_TREOI|nr:hypothetical protein TorRG33x02_003180 [Trema orientale]
MSTPMIEEEYYTGPMTKLVCMIGPEMCDLEQLEVLAMRGISITCVIREQCSGGACKEAE